MRKKYAVMVIEHYKIDQYVLIYDSYYYLNNYESLKFLFKYKAVSIIYTSVFFFDFSAQQIHLKFLRN